MYIIYSSTCSFGNKSRQDRIGLRMQILLLQHSINLVCGTESGDIIGYIGAIANWDESIYETR